MVKLTLDLISRGTSRHTKKKRDENKQQFVRRLTHLYLEHKNIDQVGDDISLCRNLLVLYMYDNHLGQIPSLSSSLTHLYLQNNNICQIDNLQSLVRLQKLFLGGNIITVLEGLEKLQQLLELHVENQRHPHGEHLLIDPRSIEGISETLQVLNISGNNLTNISELEKLSKLTQLIAGSNQFNDFQELAHLLSSCKFLWHLDLTGNPLCQRAKYKDQIIVMGKNLKVLDGKTITPTERQFLISWQAIRDIQSKRLQDNLMRQDTFSSISSEGVGGWNLPPVQSASRHRTGFSAHIMSGLPRHPAEILDKYNLPDYSRSHKVHSAIVQPNGTGTTDSSQMTGSGLVYHRRPLSVERVHLKHSGHRRRL